MMNQGKILKCDTPEAIKSSFHAEVVEVVCDDVHRAAEILSRSFERNDIQLFGDRLHILVKDAKKEESNIRRLLKAEQIAVLSYRMIPPSLEDVFIASLNV
jgi:ABC-2 type transport system ATP-binding protein